MRKRHIQLVTTAVVLLATVLVCVIDPSVRGMVMSIAVVGGCFWVGHIILALARRLDRQRMQAVRVPASHETNRQGR
jgi:hypothetical protein